MRLLPAGLHFHRHPSISVPRQIDEMPLPVYPVEVDHLRTTRGWNW